MGEQPGQGEELEMLVVIGIYSPRQYLKIKNFPLTRDEPANPLYPLYPRSALKMFFGSDCTQIREFSWSGVSDFFIGLPISKPRP